jgi:hypothetical protein
LRGEEEVTLRLVEKNNVADFPISNLQDIAAMARRFADELGNEDSQVTRAVVVIDRQDGLRVEYWGQDANAFEIMGILDYAKLTIFADDVSGD